MKQFLLNIQIDRFNLYKIEYAKKNCIKNFYNNK